MKHLSLLILLTLPCVSISQNLNQTKAADSLSFRSDVQFKLDTITPDHIWYVWKDVNYSPLVLKPAQVFNVYVGLKQGEEYKKRSIKYKADISRLNDLIQDQTEEIKQYARNEIQSGQDLINLYKAKEEKEVEIVKLKQKKWYKSPLLYLLLGFAGGAYVVK